MTKYELVLVVNAKIEDEERGSKVVEKAKNYIARYNGNVDRSRGVGQKTPCL